MKVTVKEKTENEIDFSVAGQLLISTIKDTIKDKRLVLTSGEFYGEAFSGVAINESIDSDIRRGVFHNEWNSKFFKKFNGTITIEQ
jgi:hypothetical protein